MLLHPAFPTAPGLRPEFTPDDCSCDYHQITKNCVGREEHIVHPTGSGHRLTCHSHERWLEQGGTWRPEKAQ